jgi:sarcosine oxidase, subunit gamma
MLDRQQPPITGRDVMVRLVSPTRQWSLRARKLDIERLANAWGGPLTTTPLSSGSSPDRQALHLGPDEWLLLANDPNAISRLSELPQDPPFSLVDISSRDIVLELVGPNAPRLLSAGCPLNLSETAFPPGRATRTIYAQAEVVLWRPGDRGAWQLRTLRSFADYISRHLTQAAINLKV